MFFFSFQHSLALTAGSQLTIFSNNNNNNSNNNNNNNNINSNHNNNNNNNNSPRAQNTELMSSGV